jgi:RNA polymerase sigma factor (sigma-70 family)
MSEDAELLRRYATEQSEAAFAELIRRHVDLVYSAALRLVNSDVHRAEDITQQVFTELAREANKLSRHPALAGWLYTTTRLIALRTIRTEQRRTTREREAHTMNELLRPPEPETDWNQLRPVLEDAMHDLDENDRHAVLMRFFQNKNLKEVGAALGLNENAARMRVDRALDKLRDHLARRGVTTTAGALALAITANAVQAAPAGLTATISSAMLPGATLATTTTATVTKAIAMTTLQKTLVTATFAVLAGAGLYEARRTVQLRDQLQRIQQQQTPMAEQIRQLQAQRVDDSNTIARLSEELAKKDANNLELLRLRGQASQMRSSLQEYARLKAKEQTAELGTDEKAWLERVALLKQRVAETPAAQIPELKFLTDDDWLRAAKRKLESEDDYRRALEELDSNAQGNFLRIIETALRKFLDTNQGQFPTDLSQLKSYFTNSADAELLQRYQIQPAKAVPGVLPAMQNGNNANDYVITPIITIGGGQWFLQRDGVGGTSKEGGDLMDILAPALKAMSDATPTINGRKDMSIRNLGPYLTTPEQKAAYQKLMGGADQK